MRICDLDSYSEVRFVKHLVNRAILFHNLRMADGRTQEVGKFSKLLLNKTMQLVFSFGLFQLLMFNVNELSVKTLIL